jgi:hypothetical protein
MHVTRLTTQDDGVGRGDIHTYAIASYPPQPPGCAQEPPALPIALCTHREYGAGLVTSKVASLRSAIYDICLLVAGVDTLGGREGEP